MYIIIEAKGVNQKMRDDLWRETDRADIRNDSADLQSVPSTIRYYFDMLCGH